MDFSLYIWIYSQPLWLIVLLIIGSIAFWSWISCRLQTKPHAGHHMWIITNGVLFVLSLCVILYITLLQRRAGIRYINLCPFHSLLVARVQPEIYRELLMNTFLFVPFGLTLSQILPRKWSGKSRIFLVVILGISVSIIAEVFQYYFALGTAETDDVICNSLGTLLGSLPIILGPYFSLHSNN